MVLELCGLARSSVLSTPIPRVIGDRISGPLGLLGTVSLTKGLAQSRSICLKENFITSCD